MRHLKRTAKLGRTGQHRNRMLASMVCSLIRYRRIKTTLAKARAARSVAEKMITLGKAGTLHDRLACFGRLLDETFSSHPRVRELRQRGFAAALDLAPSRDSVENFPVARRTALQVCLRARDHGLLLRPLGDSLLLVPPLCLDESELGELVHRTALALDDVLPG